jgi:RNA polymerase sigma-70 factor (ECF subfamily)
VAEHSDRQAKALRLLADEDAALLLEQLHRAVARVCPQWHSVERDDVVQAAIVRVLELRRRNPEREDLSFAYLRRVAYSAFIDEVRRRQRRGEEPLEPEGRPAVAAGNPGPERRSASREIGEAIRACLATLIRPRRLAITLHLQGHKVPEIARLLGWAAKRADNLVYRGLADLRECLAGKGVTS